ncbi:LacI family DNA-binding transcriptional regulator [Actinoplanes sp. NEAU-A12]|uniref:LacI family DNA-binding transcriptional regulator n=1 Tax=Actinoplanes sandaracinus TaxID=3045177 RepID=A0ABT6X173_9ACTN|nr:LacI family DNA-binding transcriptional regulator [Actinoplanes sandaracinus]MDI6105750.1 LacI family DNA-binding transcriptional regulator [Actinoplanes sandaracinus]
MTEAARRDRLPGGVSMADVARRAGVSSQTVSRVSTGHPGVAASTRRQVLDAMHDLGYRPNIAARALRRGRFHAIGVVMPTLTTFANSRTAEAIAEEAALEGYSVTLIPVAAATLDELAVDGIVIMDAPRFDAANLTLPRGTRVVSVGSRSDADYPVIDTDQRGGATQAVRHLLDLGHRTVWHVTGPAESYAGELRTRAWRDVMREAGIMPPPAERGDWSTLSGYQAGRRLADEPGCTAVFAANDQMALGVLRALHERGRRVPHDVSVVGFDDIPDAAAFLPPLTTMHQNFSEVGRRCVELLLGDIRGGPSGPGTVLVAPSLVRRASTAPPPR